MPRLPTADEMNTLLPTASRHISTADTSAIGRGLQQAGGALAGIGDEIRQQDMAADSARSVALWNEAEIGIKRDLRENPDWDKAPQRAQASADAAAKAAAGVIRDPSARERAALQFKTRALGVVDDANNVRFTKSRDASRAAVTESLAKTSSLYSDPTTDDTVKDGLLKGADETIQAALGTGLIDEADAIKLRNAYVMGSKVQLLENLAKAGGAMPELGVAAPPPRNAPAAIRHNNPGAMWPGSSSRKFGATGEATLNDGQGNKIATFPTPEAGAAAQFDLLSSPAYAGMSVSDAIKKWSGGNSSAEYVASLRKAGVDVNGQVATAMRDPATAIALAKSMARVEAGRDFPMSDEQWQSAYSAAFAGGKLPETSGYKAVDPRFADVPYEKRLAAYQVSDNVQKQAQAQALAQQKLIQTQTKEDFGLKIETDDPTVTSASILGNTVIDAGDKTALLKALEERQKTTGAANSLLQALRDNQSVTLNPYSEDDRKASDVAYDKLNKAAGADPEAPLKNLDRFQQLTGIVPPKAVSSLRGAMVGTDVNAATLAMQVANNLMTRNPNIFAGMPGGDDLGKKATAFSFNVEHLGMSAEKAAQRVREMDDLRAQGKIKVTDEAVKTFQDGIKKGGSILSSAAGAFDQSWWPGNPDIGTNDTMRQKMLSDYADLAGDYYRQGYSSDEAKAIAAQDLKKVWGVSHIQGSAKNGTVMEYTPELKYPAAPSSDGTVGHGYLVEQAISKVKDISGHDVKIGDIQFVPIPTKTSVAWGNNKLPPYQIQYTYKNKDGYTVHEALTGVEFIGDPTAAQKAYNDKRLNTVKDTQAEHNATDEKIMAPPQAPKVVQPGDIQNPTGTNARPLTDQERQGRADAINTKNSAQFEDMQKRAAQMDAAIQKVDAEKETRSPTFTPPDFVQKWMQGPERKATLPGRAPYKPEKPKGKR